MIDVIVGGLIWLAPLNVGCEYRSDAHIAEHGGLAADSAWHVANGELPTCGNQEETYRRNTDWVEPSDDGKRKDKKSRFCRRHWFC